MNMISTGAFLPETDASTKQNELVKKLTAAWEKKNSKTARAGGASLMALSLAACGGEDTTPFAQSDVDAAVAAAEAAVSANTGQTPIADAIAACGEKSASLLTAVTDLATPPSNAINSADEIITQETKVR